MNEKQINSSYKQAQEVYADFGVDTEKVMQQLESIPISLHCWQGDDVTGLEGKADGITGGGMMATGNYPGKARNGGELRQDIDKALSLIPGRHRLNLHAMYAEAKTFVDRDALAPEHFTEWIGWAKNKGIGLDFNGSFFSHPLAATGFTLSSRDDRIRRFWIEHAKRCREIADAFGKELGTPCICDIWIPDGYKDLPANRAIHRRILRDSLDDVLNHKFDKKNMLDVVECKLFGLGSESYVVGSHEFYMAYAISRGVMLCLDAGHFHPTEVISDKISSILTFQDELLLHVSRGVRWDSDHVVILSDELLAIAQEIKRFGAFGKVHYALDFFDASINRITAWVTGTRSALKSILIALLEPTELIQNEEAAGNFGNRLALMEEFKTLPFSAVWNKYCLDKGAPVGPAWLEEIKEYEQDVQYKRG